MTVRSFHAAPLVFGAFLLGLSPGASRGVGRPRRHGPGRPLRHGRRGRDARHRGDPGPCLPARGAARARRPGNTGDVAAVSRQLLDALSELNARIGAAAPFDVISGYRSPRSNAKPASASSGVARRSLHMKGMAIDVRVPEYSLKRLHKTAVAMKAGGVGYYPKSGFVHIDVGRVRYW